MKICVYAEPIASNPTSANPWRGMLRELVRLRTDDEFVFAVRPESRSAPVLAGFLDSLDGGRWELHVCRRSRREANLRALLGRCGYAPVGVPANVYLNMDLDRLGADEVPLIVTLADVSFVRDPAHATVPWYGRRIRAHAIRCLEKSTARIAVISRFTADDLVDLWPAFRGRTDIVPVGIDECWTRQPDPAGAPGPVGGGEARPYWIWWGYISRRKNVHGILRAWNILRQRAGRDGVPHALPDLLLVGTIGRDCRDLPALIHEIAPDGEIRLLPFQPLDRLVELVRHSKGLVFPSFYEGFGVPVLEAMALGRPVVIADRTALPEVANGLGIACAPDNPASIATAMAETLDPAQTDESACTLRRRHAASFTYARAARAWSELVERASRTEQH